VLPVATLDVQRNTGGWFRLACRRWSLGRRLSVERLTERAFSAHSLGAPLYQRNYELLLREATSDGRDSHCFPARWQRVQPVQDLQRLCCLLRKVRAAPWFACPVLIGFYSASAFKSASVICSYIPDGAACDKCVTTECPKTNECHPSKTCNVCAACCQRSTTTAAVHAPKLTDICCRCCVRAATFRMARSAMHVCRRSADKR
jgi:hypothetical protein